MLALTAMSSFSDAHELIEIPLIAANLHRLLLPRQNQIWAVLHPQDSLQRIQYSLAATFLGRMCLSGGIAGLSAEAWQLVRKMIELYEKAALVIKHGTSRRFGEVVASWRHPQGWQAVLRTSATQALVVLHTFGEAPPEVMVPLAGEWTAVGESPQPSDGMIRAVTGGDFTGHVWLYHRA